MLLAALMRHYQLRVYEPRLEADETGAQLPSPSLPNITARRLFEEWSRRAAMLSPELGAPQIDAALANLAQWTDAVPDSSNDAYHWEVERPVDKRVFRPDFLASDARASEVLERRAALPPVATAPAVVRFKTFVGGAQHGPFTLAELAAQAARGEIAVDTRVWDMRWDPKTGKWQHAGELPALAALFGAAIPDPDDAIPDPD